MSSWSRRRRSTYAAIVIVVLAGAVGVPLFYLLYTPPTCFDGLKNGSEQGTDCGGSCSRLCPNAFLPPAVSWTRYSEVAPGRYNVAAYVVNPNPKVQGRAPYKITLYGERAVPLAEITGAVTLPAGRSTLAFQDAVDAGIQKPIRAAFEFTSLPEWALAGDPVRNVTVADQRYSETASDSSLIVTLANSSVEPVRDVTVYAILLDSSGNVLDFSKTVVDEIPGAGRATAPFTWPVRHAGGVVSIEVLPVAE